MTIDLILGDCLKVMRDMPDKSVDAILTDLPYGTTACSWDEIIPFEPMWEQVKRICRGVFVTTASQPFTSKLIMSNLDWFRYEWIWEKDRATRHLDANKKPLKAHENICVFSEGSSPYNPQKTTGHKPAHRAKKDELGSLPALLREGLRASNSGGQTDRYPRDVIKINMPNHGEMGQHPTQKPVELMAYLVKTYTNEGDTVLDFAMGSGTTLVACVQTGRNGIGIESDPDYFAIAERRIHEAQRQPRLEFERT